jgi:hypothetical protein
MRLPGGVHIIATCSIESLIGHDAYEAVIWRPLRCKSIRARKAIQDLMLDPESSTPPISPTYEATALYLVHGLRACNDTLHLIDPDIRSRTRQEVGVSLINDSMRVVIIVRRDVDDGDLSDSDDA